MKTVADVLDHFRRLDRRDQYLSIDGCIELAHEVCRLLVIGADQCKRRRIEIPERRALAQELRIDADAKIPTRSSF